jgi:hypothetical protein
MLYNHKHFTSSKKAKPLSTPSPYLMRILHVQPLSLPPIFSPPPLSLQFTLHHTHLPQQCIFISLRLYLSLSLSLHTPDYNNTSQPRAPFPLVRMKIYLSCPNSPNTAALSLFHLTFQNPIPTRYCLPSSFFCRPSFLSTCNVSAAPASYPYGWLTLKGTQKAPVTLHSIPQPLSPSLSLSLSGSSLIFNLLTCYTLVAACCTCSEVASTDWCSDGRECKGRHGAKRCQALPHPLPRSLRLLVQPRGARAGGQLLRAAHPAGLVATPGPCSDPCCIWAMRRAWLEPEISGILFFRNWQSNLNLLHWYQRFNLI